MTDVPHFSYPFRFGPQAAVTEQDSLEEIADCVLVTLSCPQGYRPELPDFGISDPTFTSPVDVDDLRRAVEFWEPRALALFDADLDTVDELVTRVETLVRLRTED